MGRRAADTVTMTVWLTVREGFILDDMRARTAIDSNANLLRAALFFYAKHLDVEHLHFSDFGIRRKGQDPRRADRTTTKAVPTCAPGCVDCADDRQGKPNRPKQPRNRPRANHPWRRRLKG